jgi:ribosomal protein S18 acetylase RimI-like enzyme
MWHVRDAAPSDAGELAEVHVAAWRAGHRRVLPDAVLDGLDVAAGARRWAVVLGDPAPGSRVLVLEVGDGDDQVLAGLAVLGSRSPELGVLEEIAVDPARWGGGGGRVLLRAATDALGQAGHVEAVLSVLPDNARALSLYESEGWTADGGEVDADGRVTYRRSLTG